MFYKIKIRDHIRVPPSYFGLGVKNSVLKCVREKYENYIGEDVGIVFGVTKIENIGEGIIISGDGASYYDTTFEVISFKPEMQEIVIGKIKDIADFGAFISLGPIEGMIHVSQTMDDFVSFAKEKVLLGRETKRTLKVGDVCRARMIAISFKDPSNPKLGLTMRQPGLGKLEWIAEDEKMQKEAGEKSKTKEGSAKEEKKEKKAEKKK